MRQLEFFDKSEMTKGNILSFVDAFIYRGVLPNVKSSGSCMVILLPGVAGKDKVVVSAKELQAISDRQERRYRENHPSPTDSGVHSL